MQQSLGDLAILEPAASAARWAIAPTAADTPDGYGRRADAVAAIAAAHAGAVDAAGRFPHEALEALRAERLLGIMVPRALGGEGASLSDVVDICYRLGRACSSTAMIYAMHQSCVACVARHCDDSAWHGEFLRDVANGQRLLASSTTEGQAGGNVRASAAAIERGDGVIRLDRAATVVSYGAQADAIVTTARRAPDAAASDQVLVVFRREDYTLAQIGGWDALGMRGTCSGGFNLKAEAREAQILPQGYELIHPQSMVPVSHLAWAAAWTGIAAAAAERARAFTRRAARQGYAAGASQAPGQAALPPGAAHVTRLLASLQTLRGLLTAALRAYEARCEDRAALMALDFQARMNLTKVEASERAVAIVLEAGRACGLSGYRNDSEFSIGRQLRDVLSAPIMINNDRILANLATTSLLTPVSASLRDEGGTDAY